MKIEKNAAFSMHAAIRRKAESNDERVTKSVIIDDDPGEATLTVRVSNVVLNDDQTTQIKAIHKRAADEIEAVLGWE